MIETFNCFTQKQIEEINKKIRKNALQKEIGEDEEKSSEKSIQIITDNHIKTVDDKVSSKEKEIMTI